MVYVVPCCIDDLFGYEAIIGDDRTISACLVYKEEH